MNTLTSGLAQGSESLKKKNEIFLLTFALFFMAFGIFAITSWAQNSVRAIPCSTLSDEAQEQVSRLTGCVYYIPFSTALGLQAEAQAARQNSFEFRFYEEDPLAPEATYFKVVERREGRIVANHQMPASSFDATMGNIVVNRNTFFNNLLTGMGEGSRLRFLGGLNLGGAVLGGLASYQVYTYLSKVLGSNEPRFFGALVQRIGVLDRLYTWVDGQLTRLRNLRSAGSAVRVGHVSAQAETLSDAIRQRRFWVTPWNRTQHLVPALMTGLIALMIGYELTHEGSAWVRTFLLNGSVGIVQLTHPLMALTRDCAFYASRCQFLEGAIQTVNRASSATAGEAQSGLESALNELNREAERLQNGQAPTNALRNALDEPASAPTSRPVVGVSAQSRSRDPIRLQNWDQVRQSIQAFFRPSNITSLRAGAIGFRVDQTALRPTPRVGDRYRATSDSSSDGGARD